jgi:hypothetical protein
MGLGLGFWIKISKYCSQNDGLYKTKKDNDTLDLDQNKMKL